MTDKVHPPSATGERTLTVDEVEDAYNAASMYAVKEWHGYQDGNWNVKADFAAALCKLALKALQSEIASNEELKLALLARAQFEGDPEGALTEMEYRVRRAIECTPSETPQSDACSAALANIMARIDGDEFIPTEYKEDARKALASAPSATPCTQYRSIGMVYLTPDGVIAASLEPNVELPAKECLIYIAEGKRV